MAHEKEREITGCVYDLILRNQTEMFEDIMKTKCKTLQETVFFTGILAIIDSWKHDKIKNKFIEDFLSTLPEEKEDCQRCKYYHPPIITEPCFSCVEKSEFNPSK